MWRRKADNEEVGKLREEVRLLRAEVRQFALDYEALYEKVRNTLAKLRKRAESRDPEETLPDPMGDARKALLERKLRRGA